MKGNEHIGEFINETEQFVEAKIELIRLETVEKTISVSSAVLSWLIIFGLGFICFTLLSVIGIICLGHLMDSYLLACLSVFGVFILLFVLLLAFSKSFLLRPIKNFLLGEYLKSRNSDRNE